MNPFEIGNRYEEIGKRIDTRFSEKKYYQEATLLELCYLKHITSIRLEEGKLCDVSSEENVGLVKMINGMIYVASDIRNFSKSIFPRIKELEKLYNHDIVAVQYTLMEAFDEVNIKLGGVNSKNYVHWGLTSQDIVNTVYTKMVNDYISIDFPLVFKNMFDSFKIFSSFDNKIMGKTHGQNALPMSAKHISNVYNDRLVHVIENMSSITVRVKFGNGAVGNNFSQDLLTDTKMLDHINSATISDFIGMNCQSPFEIDINTFQNNNYPFILSVFYELHKLCNILKDLSMDMWQYSSMGYIKKGFSAKEHGSSTMPQKSNPIEFENAEGNLEIAIGMLEIYMRKLNVSRLQRDLSDLTMMRNIGMIFCYIEQSIESMNKGFQKFSWNLGGNNIIDDMRDYSYLKEFIQLREKLTPNGLDYESIKLMSNDDVKKYVIDNNIAL